MLHFLAALVLLTWPASHANAVEPVLDLYGFSLETDASEIREWLAREGFRATKTNTPGAEAYLREGDGFAQGIGFVPSRSGLDALFVNQNGITIAVDEVVRRIEARYGDPSEVETTERGYRLTYTFDNFGEQEQMVWAVQRGFVGVEIDSTGHASPSDLAKKWLDSGLEHLWSWRYAISGAIGGGLALFVLLLVLPARARRLVSNVFQAVAYPIVQALGFLGSRLFTLFFGIILIPLFVFSGCTALVSATEKNTSWLWIIPWVIGFILALESRDSSEFRYVILADIIFAATIAGVFLQMMLSGNA